ncbi:hypothetical protein [Streptomyces tremellae]|uniref:hypothetical protein n=1 Tax=Streptomyces tremellae TaxID=1124239 RepID=UPI0031EDC085
MLFCVSGFRRSQLVEQPRGRGAGTPQPAAAFQARPRHGALQEEGQVLSGGPGGVAQADLLGRLLDALGIDRACVVGHEIGDFLGVPSR